MAQQDPFCKAKENTGDTEFAHRKAANPLSPERQDYIDRRKKLRAELEAAGITENVSNKVDRIMIREGFASLDDGSDYDLFIVLRFRPYSTITPDYAHRKFDEFFKRQMRAVYGPHWDKFIPRELRCIPRLEVGVEAPHLHSYVALPASKARTKDQAIGRYLATMEPTWRKLVAGGSTWAGLATNVDRGNRYMTKQVGKTTTDRVLIF